MRKRSMDKKGQVEIIGLVMLVVILVIILVVALTFSFNIQDNGKEDLMKRLIANNLLGAIIKTEGRIDIKEIIGKCYLEASKNIKQGINCQKLREEINKIMSLTIGKRDFEISFDKDLSKFFKEGNCEKGIQSTEYRFREEGSLYSGKLKLC